MSYGEYNSTSEYEAYKYYRDRQQAEAAAADRARSAAEERQRVAEQEEADSQRRLLNSNAPRTQYRKRTSLELWNARNHGKSVFVINSACLLLFGAFIFWLLGDLLRSLNIVDAYWYAFFIGFGFSFFHICSNFTHMVTLSDVARRILEEYGEISKQGSTYVQIINTDDDEYKRLMTRVAVRNGYIIVNPEMQDYIAEFKVKEKIA